MVVAVSDGHGGDRYVRSGLGAEYAAKTTADYLKQRFSAFWDEPTDIPRLSLTELQEELPRYILRQWKSRVRQHIEATPWTDEEKLFGWHQAEMKDCYTAYGATLLFAAAIPGVHPLWTARRWRYRHRLSRRFGGATNCSE